MDFDLGIITGAVKAAFTNPTANLVTTLIVAASMLLLMLMMVLLLMLAGTPKKRKVVKIRRYRVAEASQPADVTEGGAALESAPASADAAGAEAKEAEADAPETGDEAEPAPPSRLRAAVRHTGALLTAGFMTPLLLLAALVAGYALTGTDAMCAQTCHANQATVRQAVELDHAKCVDCHEQSGVGGVVPNTLTRGRMVVAQLSGGTPGGAVVDSSRCESCHTRDIARTVTSVRGIMMSHAEPSAGGITCGSCHTTSGHTARRDYSMSSCIACHGGADASTECDTCHARDPYDTAPQTAGSGESSATVGSGKISYPVVQVGHLGCGGCHDEPRECDSCHKLRMPHSEAFIAGGHAPAAAWEKKELCLEKCHDIQWCGSSCHRRFESAHAGDWKSEHKRAPKDAGCVCHQARTGRTEPMCVLCHDF